MLAVTGSLAVPPATGGAPVAAPLGTVTAVITCTGAFVDTPVSGEPSPSDENRPKPDGPH